MSTLHLAASALLLLTAGEPAASPTHILAPEAEPAVSALLKVDKPLGKGLRVDAARVDTMPLGVDTPTDLERARAALGAS